MRRPPAGSFFGNLLDAGKATLCGEESAGTGSNHIREKDGLWAVLLWLNILAIRQQPLADIVRDHWKTYGRHFYSRHDYEAVDAAAAASVMDHLRDQIPDMPGKQAASLTIEKADDFSYTDPVDGLCLRAPGHPHLLHIRRPLRLPPLRHRHRGRDPPRLPGAFEPDPAKHDQDLQQALAPVIGAADAVSSLKQKTGRAGPSVVS